MFFVFFRVNLNHFNREIPIKMIRVLSFWYSKIVLRFLTDNEKIIYTNFERNTLQLEKENKSHLMFNETCYNRDILPTHTNIILRAFFIWECVWTLKICIYCGLWFVGAGRLRETLTILFLIEENVVTYVQPHKSRSF